MTTVYLQCVATEGSGATQTEAGFHSRMLMTVVRRRLSCQTQKHFTRLHLSWSVSEHSTRSRREGNKGREAILQHNAQLFIHHSRGLSTGMSLWIFDKDIEVQRLQLRGFIITFVAIYASSRWAERKNNKSKATEPRREPSEPITCVSCYCTLVTELQSNGDDEFDGRFDLKL